jgi:hypothetical protein
LNEGRLIWLFGPMFSGYLVNAGSIPAPRASEVFPERPLPEQPVEDL